jgi:hypothetical protein
MAENEIIPALEREKLELERQKIRVEEEKLRQGDKIEQEKLKVEQGKLKVEQEKQKEEHRKTNLTVASIVAPLLLLFVSFGFSKISDRAKENADFEVKAAEIVLNAQNPDAAWAKAKALKKLFPDRLSKKFADTFNPKDYTAEGNPDYELQMEVFRMITANPKQKQEILDTLMRLFPGTKEWAEKLK